MPGRSFSSNSYRYGFNGKEKVEEINGTGDNYDFGARIYDSKIGRWIACDPLAAKYPDMTPYAAFANNPIYFIDPDGREIKPSNKEADRAVSDIINSYNVFDKKGNIKTSGADILGLVPSRAGQNYKTSLTLDEFRANAIKAGITGDNLKQAEALFKVIQHKDVLEIAIISTSTVSHPEDKDQYQVNTFNQDVIDYMNLTDESTGTYPTQADNDNFLQKGNPNGTNYGVFPNQNSNSSIIGILIVDPKTTSSTPQMGGDKSSTQNKEREANKKVVQETITEIAP